MPKNFFFFLPLFFPLSAIAQEDDWLKTHILRMKEGLVLKLSQLIEYQIRKNFMVKMWVSSPKQPMHVGNSFENETF